MHRFHRFLVEREEARVDPKSFDLKALFRELNKQCFGGRLMDFPIAWGKCPKPAAGVTRATRTRRRGEPMIFSKVDVNSIQIIIEPHPHLLSVLKGIVAHEMCHAEVMQLGLSGHERDSHGYIFQSKMKAAQAHADFTIPMSHMMDDHAKSLLTPKNVRFIMGEMKDGKIIGALYSMNLSPADTAKIIERMPTHGQRCKWLVFGEGKTILGHTLPVQRTWKGLDPVWRMSLSDITPSRIIAAEGSPPPSFKQGIYL